MPCGLDMKMNFSLRLVKTLRSLSEGSPLANTKPPKRANIIEASPRIQSFLYCSAGIRTRGVAWSLLGSLHALVSTDCDFGLHT